METHYSWDRYWYPEGQEISFDRGYLSDPESKYAKYSTGNFSLLSELEDKSCLILLGEPGMGKTTTLKIEVEHLKTKNKQVIYTDLAEYITPHEVVFSEEIISKEGEIYLFFDSLDECRCDIKTIGDVLMRELKRFQNITELKVRIVCRTLELPESLFSGLNDIFKGGCSKYRLAPLRWKDISEVAKKDNIDPDKFHEEIRLKDAEPLARIPVTLKLLVTLFKKNDALPKTKREVYREGCIELARETNKKREELDRVGQLDSQERFDLASKLAAIMILSGKSGLWLGNNYETIESDLCIEELIDEELRKRDIKEVSQTGLFTSAGQKRISWAHRTFAEFLAADYLQKQAFKPKQLFHLIQHPDGKFVPQLYNVISWLGTMKKEVFEKVLEEEPEILLRGDLDLLNDDQKEKLLAKYIFLSSNNWFDWDYYQAYSKLRHANISQQLQDCLEKKEISPGTKTFLAIIAEVCKVTEVQNILLNYVFDPAESYSVRSASTRTICEVGDDNTKLALKNLLKAKMEDDSNDQIKGYILKALWPEHLTIDELLSVIGRNNDGFYGAYSFFLRYDFIEKMNVNDIPATLNKFEPIIFSLGDIGNAIEKLLLKAAQNLDNSQIFEAFSQYIYIQLKNHHKIPNDHDTPLSEEIKKNAQAHRSLILRLVELTENPNHIYKLLGNNENLLSTDDTLWLLDELEKATTIDIRLKLSNLIATFNDWGNYKYSNQILELCYKDKKIKENFIWFIEPVDINSSLANDLRNNHQRSFRNINHTPTNEPPLEIQILECLVKFEKGELNQWLNIVDLLAHKLSKTSIESEIVSKNKERFITAAKKYLMEQQSFSSYSDLSINRSDRAAFYGFVLLEKYDKPYLETLSSENLIKWLKSIFLYQNEEQFKNIVLSLIKRAYLLVPDEVLKNLLFLFNNGQGDDIAFEIWDERLKSNFLEELQKDNLSFFGKTNLLRVLIKKDVPEAVQFIKDKSGLISDVNDLQEDVLSYIFLLIELRPEIHWNWIWDKFFSGRIFGRKLIEEFVIIGEYSELFSRLSNEQNADLVIWLEQNYHASEDPDHSSPGFRNVRVIITSFRSDIINYLKNIGAYQQIEKIQQQFPESTGLSYIYNQAQINYREKSWTPPSAKDLIQKFKNHEKKLIQSESQLLDFVVETLYELEQRLQKTENAAVWDLWNTKPKYQPKSENEFSDYIARYLRDTIQEKGIIINREVEINRGKKTDIKVECFTTDEISLWKVIIEVKGCWHVDIDTAMQTQLVNRYLKDYESKRGIYLIGWFLCDKWDKSDNRYGKTKKITKSEAQVKYNNKANDLSSCDYDIRAIVLDTRLKD